MRRGREVIPPDIFLSKLAVKTAIEMTESEGFPIYNWNFQPGKLYDLDKERKRRRPLPKPPTHAA